MLEPAATTTGRDAPAGPRPSTVGPGRHIPEGSRLVSEGQDRPSSTAAVFLDRDGVIVEDVNYLSEVSKLRVLPGVPEALQALRARFYLIVVTNQSGIARGMFTEDVLEEIHSELARRLTADDAIIDAFYYCPHLPEAPTAAYSRACNCRKPGPGMLLRAAADWDIDMDGSFMVGDMPRDADAGKRAGVTSILLGDGRGAGSRDLGEAARLIRTSTGNISSFSPPGRQSKGKGG